jgi:4-hydroxyphenylacetate 3-monooxygenase
MARDPEPWIGDTVIPKLKYGLTYRVFMINGYPIYLPSSARDFHSPRVRPYLDKYVRGSDGMPAVERVKVMKALWDARVRDIVTSFQRDHSSRYRDVHHSG